MAKMQGLQALGDAAARWPTASHVLHRLTEAMKHVERLLNNRIIRVRAEIDRLKRELDQHGRCQRIEERIGEAKEELSWLMHLGCEESYR